MVRRGKAVLGQVFGYVPRNGHIPERILLVLCKNGHVSRFVVPSLLHTRVGGMFDGGNVLWHLHSCELLGSVNVASFWGVGPLYQAGTVANDNPLGNTGDRQVCTKVCGSSRAVPVHILTAGCPYRGRGSAWDDGTEGQAGMSSQETFDGFTSLGRASL